MRAQREPVVMRRWARWWAQPSSRLNPAWASEKLEAVRDRIPAIRAAETPSEGVFNSGVAPGPPSRSGQPVVATFHR